MTACLPSPPLIQFKRAASHIYRTLLIHKPAASRHCPSVEQQSVQNHVFPDQGASFLHRREADPAQTQGQPQHSVVWHVRKVKHGTSQQQCSSTGGARSMAATCTSRCHARTCLPTPCELRGASPAPCFFSTDSETSIALKATIQGVKRAKRKVESSTVHSGSCLARLFSSALAHGLK